MNIFKRKKKPVVSVIMAVYNAEKYLDEAVGSIIDQTIGFKNIQLILVDDGSTDGSAGICDGYGNKYADNVVVIHKENGGVSSARNAGLEVAEGEFINFFDSDDKWEPDAYEKLVAFANKKENRLDSVTAPVRIFGYSEYDHPMNYRFGSDGVVDIHKRPDYMMTLVCNVLFRREAIKDLRFDESVTLGEDTLFNTEFLMKHPSYGLVCDTRWWYRKHEPGVSLSGNNFHNRIWYLDYPDNVLKAVAEMSKAAYGEVIPYAREIILYWLRYAILDKGIHETLTEEEFEEFDAKYKSLIKLVDDERINKCKYLPLICRNHMLRLKHGEDVFENSTMDEKGRLLYKGNVIFSPSGKGLVHITDITGDGDETVISGITRITRGEGRCEILLDPGNDGKDPVPVKLTETTMQRFTYDGAIANQEDRFTVSFRPEEGRKNAFVTRYIDGDGLYYPRVTWEEDCEEEYRRLF